MAEVKITTKKVVTLILSEAEAEWLKGVMKRPLNGNHNPDDEDRKDRNNRYEIFDALNDMRI